jgi:membrane protease YdiL (CAAX protease family)
MKEMKTLVRVVLFYVFMWISLILLGGIQQETGLLPPEIGLAQWGPGLAGMLMLLIFRGDDHHITFINKATPVLRYVLAALIPPGVGLVVLALSTLAVSKSADSGLAYNSLWLIILWAPIGALGEEIGWRGYLHKLLNSKMRGLVSSLLVGLLWMPMHIHFFSEGALFMLFFTLLTISFSIVIYALVQDTGFNVLLATLFHLSINLTNLLFIDIIYETTFMVINGIAWAVLAAIVILMKKQVFDLTGKKMIDEYGDMEC